MPTMLMEFSAVEKKAKTSSLVTRSELANELRIQSQTLAVMAMRGDGPTFIKVGRAVRYRRADVDAWLASRTHNTTPEVMA